MDHRVAKTDLRSWAKSLPPPSLEESAAVVAGLSEWLEELEPAAVLVYVSMPGEIPAEDVVNHGAHHFYTTRTPTSGWLTVHDFNTPRERHRFGYEQPAENAPDVDPAVIDVVLAPGLCFDRSGVRLGWGKGYYDNLFERMRSDVMAVGVTLERRVLAAVPSEPHDHRMDYLATEHGVRAV
ncbi:MAG: 5-formyltetrahydrofolate cyclo-ligase [Acidimicrobiia bacterium]|nr:5-formyltetrahydrofolate cyclo-ligase [Acidimicrobiia bacterium]MDH4308934.1 5-formyltetrahydrofolate cyclo-ligase [Acidimicrobiia bacterium]MDH5293703.1 5-formyltetrahydrofolate cyclo-ligase [Acidimicrobiia bacterium]